jgi:cytoskeleton protein RodZ
MSEAAGSAAAPSAGQLLREARERQGLHIAALAASIKVTPKKLELLEADRFDALPDATFTRALAQTVCRALKIDPAAVLRLLPPPAGQRLEQVGEGLNAPFRERPGVGAQRERTASGLGPVFWVTVLILGAAIALYYLPPGWLPLVGWHGDAVKPITAAHAESASPATTPASGSLVTPSIAEPSTLAAPAAAEPIPPGAEPIPPGTAPLAAPPIAAAASS